jgi:hypothetical protein
VVLLRYLSEPALRATITAITNRAESFHGFADWLGFGAQGGVIAHKRAVYQELRIGRDLAITGFDASVGTALLQPPLTSVIIPVYDVARRVVGRTLRQIENGPYPEPGEIVPTRLRRCSPRPPTRPRAGPRAADQVGHGWVLINLSR